jgi:uncharacterized protein YbjQ (UPF0145 family)
MQKIAIFLLAVFLPSCYGYNVVEQFTPLEPVDCKVYPEEVFLFFVGENSDFKYQRVGTITITGNHNTTTEDALSRLKTQASNHCANAIIGIQATSANRTSGTYMDNDEFGYQANIVTGLAVRVVRDSAFNAKYGHLAKTDFRQKVNESEMNEKKKENDSILLGVIIVGLALLFAIAVGAASE